MTRDDLAGFRLAAGDALFLDFDGTLAEIGPNPDAVYPPRTTADDLARLAARLGGALAVLSGRDLRDLAKRTPEGLWRAGAHGLEAAAPGARPAAFAPEAPAAVVAPLDALAASRPGVRVERKGPVTAVHFRARPEAEAACLFAAEEAAAAAPDHVFQAGKMVVEVKPRGANKGVALRRFLEASPFAGRRPVMIGDDRTDEDAIVAALDLGGVGIKVGEGETRAALRTPSPETLRAWIAREAGGAP